MKHFHPDGLPEDYFYTHHEFDTGDLENFQKYHREVSGVSLAEYENALQDLGIDKKNIRKKILQIKKQIGTIGALKNAKGNFGESQASYYLEQQENFLILEFGWSESPFKGHTSVDVYGVDPTRKYCAYIESKAAFKNNSTTSLISDLIKNQLCLERIMVWSDIGDTSIQAISKSYQNRIEKNSSNQENPDKVIDTLFKDRLLRIGVILHKKDQHHDHSENLRLLWREEEEWKKQNPRFKNIECFPTRVIDLKNLKLEEHFGYWLLSADIICKVRG
jgi:DNA-directed RNA polymerase subunit N (RpoN/RPB10)